MTTTLDHRNAIAPVASFKAAAGAPEGTFEAIVSVFGNVDHAGDRVQRGAFTRSLAEWAAAGDPIPVIFSHRWNDLDSHIGVVTAAEELAPGDARLAGTGLEANGGLWVRAALDLDQPFASRVFTLLERRSLKEFSFSYDIAPGGARVASDGITDLTDLDIFEVGPTLKGMNPETALLHAKTLHLADVSGLTPSQVLVEATLKALELDDDDTVDVHVWGQEAPVARLRAGNLTTAKAVADAKASGRPTGSIEATYFDPLRAAVTAWAIDTYPDDLYAVHLDGTFPDESRVVVITERWEDPIGEGPVWELNYTTDDTGAFVVGAAREVDPVITFAPKARKAAALRRASLPNIGLEMDPPPAPPATTPAEAAKALDDILRAELDLAAE